MTIKATWNEPGIDSTSRKSYFNSMTLSKLPKTIKSAGYIKPGWHEPRNALDARDRVTLRGEDRCHSPPPREVAAACSARGPAPGRRDRTARLERASGRGPSTHLIRAKMKPDRRVATSARRITDQNPWVSLIG